MHKYSELHIRNNMREDYMWRNTFDSVVPAYHMNKTHWNSIILDGSIPENEIKNMIYDSFELTKLNKGSKRK